MGKADGDCTKATGTAGVLCGVEAAVPLTFQHGVCRRFELLKIPYFKKRSFKMR